MCIRATILLSLCIAAAAGLTTGKTALAGGIYNCDLYWDGIIDERDFALFAQHWCAADCSINSNWCQGADINHDRLVNFKDVAIIQLAWLEQDKAPPSPDPMKWDTSLDSQGFDGKPREVWIGPNATWDWGVTMRADPNTFDDTRFEFYFECTRPGYGAFSSGWRSFPDGLPYEYTVLIGQKGFVTTWRVRARDKSINQNTTNWSTIVPVN